MRVMLKRVDKTPWFGVQNLQMNSNALLVDAHQMLTLPNPTGKRNCSLLCLLVSGTGTNNFSLVAQVVAKLVVHRSRASERDSPQRFELKTLYL